MGVKRIGKNRILVAGDIMLDIYCEGEIDRISPEAPVPVFRYKGDRCSPGGAANVAANLIAAGQEVSILSTVGDDENGNRLLNILSSMGADTDMVIKTGRVTTCKTRFIAGHGSQVMRTDIEETGDIPDDTVTAALDMLKDRIDEYSIIILSDYRKGVLTERLVRGIIGLAEEKGIRVTADIKGNPDGRFNGCYLVKPNKKELSELTGRVLKTGKEVEDAAAELLLDTGCDYVLVTLGAGGMMLVEKDLVTHFPACAREVFDVTGAGDTAIAYLAACLADDIDIKEAVRIANIASGIEVGMAGTYQPVLDEVMALMEDGPEKHSSVILDRSDAEVLRDRIPGKRLVFTNGCFDIIHAGHVRYLSEAAKLGDVLVVGVNSDASVRRLKGESRPVNSLGDRMEVLSALSFVDYVIPFEEDTPYELIRDIAPDIIVKGGDYLPEEVVGKDIVESRGGRVVIIPLTGGRSTTSVIERIRNGFL